MLKADTRQARPPRSADKSIRARAFFSRWKEQRYAEPGASVSKQPDRRTRRDQTRFAVEDRRKLSPQTERRLIALIALLSAAYVVLLGALSFANHAGPERWWWSTVNLYLPQWIWGLPAPALALAAASVECRRRVAWLYLLPFLWVAGQLMGFHWPLTLSRSPVADDDTPVQVRVMTYNLQGGRRDAAEVVKAIQSTRPDLVLAQEAKGIDFGAALQRADSRWQVRTMGEYLIASRLPLIKAKLYPLPSLADDPYKKPCYVRCVVRAGASSLVVYNVHLSTPRPALAALKDGEGGAFSQLETNTATRLHQAVVLSQSLRREKGPVLVAGDLNAPAHSLVVRQLLNTGLSDVFSAAGRGYGYTAGHALRSGHSFVRIDHVLSSRHWKARKVWTGSSLGADHRPVTTDLTLLPPAP